MALVPPTSQTRGYPIALPGATVATRYVGGTTSGAPVSGTFAVGDFVVDQTGKMYVCTVAGSPGTWTATGNTNFVPVVAQTGQTWYYATPYQSAQLLVLTEARLEAIAFPLPVCTIDRIGVQTTVASAVNGVARFGIYNDSGFGYPGTLLLDGGTASLSGGAAAIEVTVSQAIATAGLYWLCVAEQGAAATPATARAGNMWTPPLISHFTTAPTNSLITGYQVAGVTGALPTPFGAAPLTLNVGAAPRLYVRIA